MRDFIQFLTALAVLAIVQYLALALSVVLLILLLMAAVVHPRRTLQLLATVGLLGLAFKAPAHCAAAIGAAAVALTVSAHLSERRSRSAQRSTLLLTYVGTDDAP
ncbi:hypothetical protein [uncultured Sphingomonas sp.]|uniref:hypothetical protein n=1 Tax=uncultured Sphingomonas sp. TaxID=158754 RepID=UPI0026206D40|nr:hypothetical protein [uncultured Sphingomonas sp.]